MADKKNKTTKLFCLRKNNLFIAWDGKSLVEKPHEGIRASRTLAERKYPGYEQIPFPEAYEQWHRALQGAKA
jgi:hypothetical protein